MTPLVTKAVGSALPPPIISHSLCHPAFPVRDPSSLCAEHRTEVIVSGMEVYIPHSLSRPESSNLWFNAACSRAIHDREAAHKWYLSLPSPESHALYISARNHAKFVL